MMIIESCNAPRNNPLDLLSSGYSFAELSGTVYTLPYSGIPGVSVYWSPSDKLVLTDNNGNFQINNILPVNGELIFQKNGYISDTVNVNWGNAKVWNKQVKLNSIPSLDSIQIYTVVINQFSPPGQTYQLVVNAKITDRQNAIDTVFVENSQLGLRYPMNFDAANKIYTVSLTTQQMSITDLEQTIGLNFNINADVYNSEINIGSASVTRVIKTPAMIQYPANDTTIGPTPTFIWQRYRAGYSFNYKIEVYTNDISNPQLVFSADSISSSLVSYNITTPLPAGYYYWVIWVVDQFKNRSRSLPATFIVQ